MKNAKTFNAIISVHMEYCNGGTLRKYIQDHGSDMLMAAKLDLIHEILLGVQHLHRCKVVHCDLRGDNIYIHVGADRPIVKIGDFGNSRMEGVEEQNMHYDSDVSASSLFNYQLTHLHFLTSLVPPHNDEDLITWTRFL